MRDTADDLVTSAEAAALITAISGRSCVPENVRRLARAGQLAVEMTIANGRQRLFRRDTVVQFAEQRHHGRGAV